MFFLKLDWELISPIVVFQTKIPKVKYNEKIDKNYIYISYRSSLFDNPSNLFQLLIKIRIVKGNLPPSDKRETFFISLQSLFLKCIILFNLPRWHKDLDSYNGFNNLFCYLSTVSVIFLDTTFFLSYSFSGNISLFFNGISM